MSPLQHQQYMVQWKAASNGIYTVQSFLSWCYPIWLLIKATTRDHKIYLLKESPSKDWVDILISGPRETLNLFISILVKSHSWRTSLLPILFFKQHWNYISSFLYFWIFLKCLDLYYVQAVEAWLNQSWKGHS